MFPQIPLATFVFHLRHRLWSSSNHKKHPRRSVAIAPITWQPWMNTLTHDKGLLVQVYTVDDPVDYKKVMAAGVDGIFTNRAAGC